jgi:hypothetical protein
LNDYGVAMFAFDARHVLFQYDLSENNQSLTGADEDGFDLDSYAEQSIVQLCYTTGNAGAGFMIGSYVLAANNIGPVQEDDVIRYNISENDSTQNVYGDLLIESWAATGLEAYNNTFYATGSAQAIGFEQNGTPPPMASYQGESGLSPMRLTMPGWRRDGQ